MKSKVVAFLESKMKALGKEKMFLHEHDFSKKEIFEKWILKQLYHEKKEKDLQRYISMKSHMKEIK